MPTAKQNDTCRNCGGDEGLHHYQTMQCPVGGVEANINHKQKYMTSRYEQESDDLAACRDALAAQMSETESLRERIAALNAENHVLHSALTLAQTRARDAGRKLRRARMVAAQGEDY